MPRYPDPRILPTATAEQIAAHEQRIVEEEAMLNQMIDGFDAFVNGGMSEVVTPPKASKFELAAQAEVDRDLPAKLAEYKAMTKARLRDLIISMGGRVTGNFQPIRSYSGKNDYVRAALSTWAATVYTRHTGIRHDYIPVAQDI